jgi:hypothetical protein
VTSAVYVRQLGYTFGVQVSGCIASFVAVTLVAVILDLFGQSVSGLDVIICHCFAK